MNRNTVCAKPVVVSAMKLVVDSEQRGKLTEKYIIGIVLGADKTL